MSQITPLAQYLIQGAPVQEQAAIEKQRQLRKAQALEKDMAAHEDELEHQVESSEEVQPVQDEGEMHHRQRKGAMGHQDPEDEGDEDGKPPHIDLTA